MTTLFADQVDRRRALLAYLMGSAALFALMVVHTAHEQWANPDFFVHLAAVREFAQNPFDPGNPILTGRDPDPYLSPYTWLVALPVSLLAVDPVGALAVAGLLNLVLLLFALHQFVRSLSSEAWAPLLTLLFTLVGWGLPTWRWSGMLNLNSLGFGLPYGSMFATGVALFVLAESERYLQRGRQRSLAVVALGTPLVVITHPMTALWAAALGAGIVLAKLDRERARRCMALAGAALLGLATTLVWPFYPVVELGPNYRHHQAINVYTSFFQRTFLGFLGLLALAWRFRDRLVRDPVLIGAALTGGLCLAGWLIPMQILGRALPGLMLMLHVALADQTAKILRSTRSRAVRVATATAIALIALVGLVGTAPGLIRAVPRPLLPGRYANDSRLESLVEPYRVLADHIERDDVVVAYPHLSVGTAAMGGHVIAPYIPAAFVEDREQRRALEAVILRSPDPRARAEAMTENHVRWLVVPPQRVDEHLRALEESGLRGSLEIRTRYLALIGTNGSRAPVAPVDTADDLPAGTGETKTPGESAAGSAE